jgi:hypothetical protein
VLSREIVQQLKTVLRQNTVLQSLDLASTYLERGFGRDCPVLYRNASIKTLDLSSNDLDDVESANILREMIRRNKTIKLCIGDNTFGRNAAAAGAFSKGCVAIQPYSSLIFAVWTGRPGGSNLANTLYSNATMVKLNSLERNHLVGVRALVNVEAVKTLTACLHV